MNCRHCHSPLDTLFLDLGFQPPSNAYLNKEDLSRAEITYPLRLRVCRECWLVQTEDYVNETDFFSPDYAYFSSVSTSWLSHSADYCRMVTKKLKLNRNSFVIEVASNDGYLLRNFVEQGIPCLGIEPTDSTADMAEKAGVPTIRKFFGQALAEELANKGQYADLILGNNVYAHVPDINDFTAGLRTLIKPEGVITLEFPHLMQLVAHSQFDTVYHEHFSYLSLYTVKRIFEKNGLKVFDVEMLNTHGGSLRVYGCRQESGKTESSSVVKLLDEEKSRGMQNMTFYEGFQDKADQIKNDLLEFLITTKKQGKRISAYGAAAKGNTLLNYAGVKPDLVPFVCDAAKAKQNRFMPGSHIPIYSPDILKKSPPDYLLILPWNIADEVMKQNRVLTEHGTRYVTAVPELRIV